MAANGTATPSENDPQLGPRATKIRERLRNPAKEDEEVEISLEESGVQHATQAGQSFTKALHTHEKTLHSLVKQGCTMVGNVEVAAVSGEVAAVVESEARRDAWKDALDKDTKTTQKALNQIFKSWDVTIGLTVPEELYDNLSQLREWSQDLTDQKKSVIEGLRAELRELDTTYSRELFQHTREREELLRRITEHVMELHQAYRASLREVQNVADKERSGLITHYSEVWEKAVEDLNQQLHLLLHQRLHNRNSRMDDVIELQLHGAAPHAAIKDTLDSQIEKVLVEVMMVKAAQQLEESQLRYNQQVLQQQYRETTALVSEGRRNLNALTPTLNNSRRKAEAAEERHQAKEHAILRETSRVRDLIQQYRSRLSNTNTSYTKQARALAHMHYQTMHQLVMQIVETERAIQHGVLAREWVEPDLTPLTELSPALNPRDTPALAAATRILTQSDSASVGGSETDAVGVEEEFLNKLAEVAVFLVDTDTAHLQEQGSILMLEHIFWELMIHTEADVMKLFRLAARRLNAKQRKAQDIAREDEEEGAEREDGDSVLSDTGGLFTSEDVLAILINFSEARTSSGKVKVGDGEDGGVDIDYSEEEEESTRWRTFLDNFCKRSRVWAATKLALTQYKDVLSGRLDETRKVEQLRRENAELKYLLQSVLADN